MTEDEGEAGGNEESERAIEAEWRGVANGLEPKIVRVSEGVSRYQQTKGNNRGGGRWRLGDTLLEEVLSEKGLEDEEELDGTSRAEQDMGILHF